MGAGVRVGVDVAVGVIVDVYVKVALTTVGSTVVIGTFWFLDLLTLVVVNELVVVKDVTLRDSDGVADVELAELWAETKDNREEASRVKTMHERHAERELVTMIEETGKPTLPKCQVVVKEREGYYRPLFTVNIRRRSAAKVLEARDCTAYYIRNQRNDLVISPTERLRKAHARARLHLVGGEW